MSPGEVISYHSLVVMPIMRLHDAYSTFTSVFCSPPLSGVLFPYFPCFIFLNASASYLNFFLCRVFSVSCIATFFYTIIAGDLVNISWGGLFIVFCFTIIIPSFPMLCEYKLVADTLRLGLPIRVITRLVI